MRIGLGLGLSYFGGASAPELPATVKLVAEGDSITAGGYPGTAVPSLVTAGPTYTVANIATAGIGINLINSNFASRIGPEIDDPEMNIVSVLAGTNDGAVTAAKSIYLDLRRIIRKSFLAGANKVIVSTLTSRSDNAGDAPNGNGYFDADTLPLNENIRAYYNSDLNADALVDYAADAIFATASAADNVTYYSDKLHPTTAGQNAMAALYATQINNVLLAPGTRVDAPATWSPFDSFGSFGQLTNSDRTFSWTSGFGFLSCRGFIGKSTGKWYWEIAVDEIDFTGAGICNFDYSYDDSWFKGMTDSTNCIGAGWTSGGGNGGSLYYNGTQLTTQPTFTDNNVLEFAMDADAKLMWFRKAGQDWNGSGSADPATGVGGVDMTDLGPGPYYPVCFVFSGASQLTSRFTAGQVAGSIPSGFSALSS